MLAENNTTNLSSSLVTSSNSPVPIDRNQTPETYLGTERVQTYIGSPSLGSQPDQTYSYASHLDNSSWSLTGEWNVTSSSITAVNDSKLRINFAAKNVYLVGGSPNPNSVGVSFNNKPISDISAAGADVTNSQLAIGISNLYRVASFKEFTTGIIELSVPSGVTLNTFTFGN